MSLTNPETQTVPQPSYAQKTEPRKKFSWGKIVHNIGNIGSGLGKVLSFLFYAFLIMTFVSASSLFGTGETDQGEVLYGMGQDKIAVIDISGMIIEEDTQTSVLPQSGITTYRSVLRTLESIAHQPDVKAIVLRINSPGGSVTASEEIYQVINHYKQGIDIPVVASMGDTAASGGYYVALAADHIMANPSTLTGSIGVILQTLNFNQLAAEYGVETITITSGPNKDLLNPLQPVDDNQRALLQEVVNESYRQFLDRILASRPTITAEQLQPIADGRVLSGKQALEVNLVDSIGSFTDATAKAAELAGISDPQIVVYGKPSFLESFLGAMSSKVSLVAYNPLDRFAHLNARPAYLFMP